MMGMMCYLMKESIGYLKIVSKTYNNAEKPYIRQNMNINLVFDSIYRICIKKPHYVRF